MNGILVISNSKFNEHPTLMNTILPNASLVIGHAFEVIQEFFHDAGDELVTFPGCASSARLAHFHFEQLDPSATAQPDPVGLTSFPRRDGTWKKCHYIFCTCYHRSYSCSKALTGLKI